MVPIKVNFYDLYGNITQSTVLLFTNKPVEAGTNLGVFFMDEYPIYVEQGGVLTLIEYFSNAYDALKHIEFHYSHLSFGFQWFPA